MTIAKLLLLLVTVICQQYAWTSPNNAPPTKELRQQVGSERFGYHLVSVFKAEMWIVSLLECSVLFALSGYCPPALAGPILHFLLPTSLTTTSDPSNIPGPALAAFTAFTPAFLTGALLSIGGTLLRAHCYRALGQHFTFELSLRPTHTLITKGVYGIVRHPSYTGSMVVVMGWFCYLLDPRGWFVRMCTGGSVDAKVMSVLAGVWVLRFSLVFLGSHGRMNKEDAMLEKNFGEEWRVWAKKVPCRLVPGVY